MKIAFVGIKRKYTELGLDYCDSFNRYHLELPYYYARDGKNDVVITTVDYVDATGPFLDDDRSLRCITESAWVRAKHVHTADVVVHWRKFFPEFYRKNAINVVNCQDHSFSDEWKNTIVDAYTTGKLRGILCFPHWHKQNLFNELNGALKNEDLFDGVTLGVDTDIYTPSDNKNPYHMLWASDPGRGLKSALELATRLFSVDKNFRLHICHPDYAKANSITHPGIVWHGNVNNGPDLWKLFNETGVLPYTSNFKEPSSRAHRQAMAAGSLVLYPNDMGTPSDLIKSMQTGIVAPIDSWVPLIIKSVYSGAWKDMGIAAREYAVSENWEVQANRFNDLFKKLLGDNNAD